MGRLLIASALMAGCATSGANGSTGHRTDCEWGVNFETGVCNPEPIRPEVPKLRRLHTVEGDAEIDGFELVAVPEGAAAWRLQIRNNTNALASVLWDESTFIASTGLAAGRLVTGSTRKIVVAKAQPSAPVPPGASIIEWVVPEKLVYAEEEEAKIEEASESRWLTHQLVASINDARAKRYRLIVGGKLYVTIQTVNGKLTWTGVVKPPVETKTE